MSCLGVSRHLLVERAGTAMEILDAGPEGGKTLWKNLLKGLRNWCQGGEASEESSRSWRMSILTQRMGEASGRSFSKLEFEAGAKVVKPRKGLLAAGDPRGSR